MPVPPEKRFLINFFARIGPTPHRDRLIPLEHHVVAENFRQAHRRVGHGGHDADNDAGCESKAQWLWDVRYFHGAWIEVVARDVMLDCPQDRAYCSMTSRMPTSCTGWNASYGRRIADLASAGLLAQDPPRATLRSPASPLLRPSSS